MREIMNDPHIRARGVIGAFQHPREGEFPALRTPLRFQGFEDPEPGCPPLLGADTEAILGELGLAADDIAELRAKGAL